MQNWERELHVSRVISGRLRLIIDGQLLYFGQPTREQKYIANEIYRDTLREAEMNDIYNGEEILNLLKLNYVWTDAMEDELKLLREKIEDMKVELFGKWSQTNARFAIRNALKKGKDEVDRLEGIKHGQDYLTCDGLALAAKYRYLVGSSLFWGTGGLFWAGPNDWAAPDPLVDQVMDVLHRERLVESQYRELALNDPWRSIWGGKDSAGSGILGVAAVDLTDEQRMLMLWSSIFDNVRESQDAPGEDVFADDDRFDGWCILRRRKRESEDSQKRLEGVNQKVLNSDEVFFVADTVEDAREIERLNDAGASARKKQRMAFLKSRGEVVEAEMPDTHLALQMQATQLEMARIKGNR